MRTLRFGRTNAIVSAVSLGTWGHGGPKLAGELSVGWSGHDDRLAREALIKAYHAGITHWDTADVYGDGQAEALIGSVWKEVPRESIFLATKVGWDPGPYPRQYDPRQIRHQLEKSLRLLRTDTVDLYYFHHCNFDRLDDALEMFKTLRDEGKFRFLGLSDWDSGKIMKHIATIDPDVVQPYRNIMEDQYESSGLKRWVEEHDLGVAFFSPLKHGLLLGKYTEPVSFPEGDFRRGVWEFGDANVIAKMRANREKVAARFPSHPQPVLHAVLGALLADSPTACVLLGQRNPSQVEAAASVGESLSREDAEWVRALYR